MPLPAPDRPVAEVVLCDVPNCRKVFPRLQMAEWPPLCPRCRSRVFDAARGYKHTTRGRQRKEAAGAAD